MDVNHFLLALNAPETGFEIPAPRRAIHQTRSMESACDRVVPLGEADPTTKRCIERQARERGMSTEEYLRMHFPSWFV